MVICGYLRCLHATRHGGIRNEPFWKEMGVTSAVKNIELFPLDGLAILIE
jgi:hypothetical protein